MSETVKIAVDFRFLLLDKLQALTLVRDIQGATYCPAANNNYFVGSVPLSENYLDDIQHFFIRQKVLENNCDILLSVQSEQDTGSASLPHIVNRMLKDINCSLTFSFETGVKA